MIEAIVGVALRAILASVLLGGVLAALVLVATRTLSLTAATRHALWTTALIATALMPLAGIGVSIARATVAASPASPPATQAALGMTPSSPARTVHEETFAIVDDTAAVPVTTAAPLKSFADRLALADRLAFAAWTPRLSRELAFGVVAVWSLGALIGLIGLAASVARVRGLKRRSSPLDGALADELPWLTEVGPGREIYLRLSYETETPVAIGFRRPVILIPTELATADGLAAIESLILHEHAHLRRNDDWTNLLQRAIERVFWFNPIVWLVGRRIALEREIASDDAVVEKTGEAHAYATSLWKLVREMRMPEHAVVAPGALLTRKQIAVRIEQLLDKKRARLHRSPVAALGVALAGVLSVAFVATSAPAVELPARPAPAVAAESAVHPAARAPHRANATRGRIMTAHAKLLPAQHGATVAAMTAAQFVAAERALKAASATGTKASLTQANDAQSKAVQAQLKALRAELAAAKKSTTVVHEKTVQIVERAPQAPSAPSAPTAPFGPVAPALPPLPATAPTMRALSPQAVAKIQAMAAAAGAGATVARARSDAAQEKLGPEIERTIKVVMDSIPRQITFEMNGSHTRITSASPRRVRFDGMKLTREMIASCAGCSFRNADARGLDLHDLRLSADNFSGADMRGVNLAGAKLAAVSLVRANLANADLRGAQFTSVELRDTNLDGAQLEGLRLAGVSINHMSLRGVALRSVVANCVGCEFTNLDLHGQDLHGLTLTGANFSHADLHDANLSGVRFFSVDLTRANLTGADLTNAYLETCDLDGADLRGARTAGMTTHAGGLEG
ncbi:MAG TPA: M56 family metallopeptidase [Candidatus Elarobacter sp.]|nr:M56 family metallopeptidase [Candidatus Elarobacter sp.]